MTFLPMQFLIPRYLIALRPNYIPQRLILEHPYLTIRSCLNVRDQVINPYQTTALQFVYFKF